MKIITKFKDGTTFISEVGENSPLVGDFLALLEEGKDNNANVNLNGQVRKFEELYSVEIVL